METGESGDEVVDVRVGEDSGVVTTGSGVGIDLGVVTDLGVMTTESGVGMDLGSGEFESDDGDEPPDTEALVAEALQRQPSGLEVPFELRPCDVEDEQRIEQFQCSCKRWGGKQCSLQFTKEYLRDVHLSFKEMPRSERELMVFGQLIAFTNNSSTVVAESRHQPTERKRGYANYQHQGKAICQDTFLFVHAIGKRSLRTLSGKLKSFGVHVPVHGNKGRLPKNTLTMRSVEYVIRFLLNFTDFFSLVVFLDTAVVTSNFFLQESNLEDVL